jgi:hypothetical protein
MGNVLDNLRRDTAATEWIDETSDIFAASKYWHRGRYDFDARWRSLVADRVLCKSLGSTPVEFGQYFRAMEPPSIHDSDNGLQTSSSTTENYTMEDADTNELELSIAYSFADVFDHSVRGRRYCRTVNGNVGLMLKYTALVDIICIIAGARVPFVIRPPSATRYGIQTYSLVGECYVHGMMREERRFSKEEFEQITLV